MRLRKARRVRALSRPVFLRLWLHQIFNFLIFLIRMRRYWTNKADYPPGSLVTIYGSDFSPDANVSLTLTNPDNSTYSWSVFANSTGAFTTTYQLIVMGHLYFVVATDGTNTAETTFTDSGLGLDTACQGFGSSATSTYSHNRVNYLRGR